MRIAFPGESAEYRAARDRLLAQEVELRRAMEAVAAARRALPPGGVLAEDYALHGAAANGDPTTVRLSELFAAGQDSLVVYSMMFPRHPGDDDPAGGQTRCCRCQGPCPSCVALLDQLDGAVEHASQHVSLAVVAKAPIERVLAFARERGWRRLRLLSSAGTPTTATTSPRPPRATRARCSTCSTATATTIRHFWGSELFYAPTEPGQDTRHVGTLEPVWNLFDLTPRGPPADWDEQLRY